MSKPSGSVVVTKRGRYEASICIANPQLTYYRTVSELFSKLLFGQFKAHGNNQQ
jgi:hypothetical protein